MKLTSFIVTAGDENADIVQHKFERILTMVRVHGVKTSLLMDYIHRPASSIEHDVSETGSVSVLRWK
jgi:hypothetical protein